MLLLRLHNVNTGLLSIDMLLLHVNTDLLGVDATDSCKLIADDLQIQL